MNSDFGNRNPEDSVSIILKYFPHLSSAQIEKFSVLQKLYSDWNEKINVISRKDIDHLYERHVLHSLSIAKFILFKPGTKVLDVGTGGGFPGIPLAILFPEVKFDLVDSIGKKIGVVRSISESLQLKNVVAEKIRAEQLKGGFDFVVSRAVDSLKSIYEWTRHLVNDEKKILNLTIADRTHGWICLKGGDLAEEIQSLHRPVQQVPVSDFFEEDFFREKFIVFFRS